MSRLRRRRVPDQNPPPTDETHDDGHGKRMTIFEHLEELRSRLFKAFSALIVGTIAGVILAEPVLKYLLEPYQAINPDEAQRLLVLGPTGAVVAYFRVSLLLGAIIAVPVMTYQMMMFVIPGLTRKERRYILVSLPAITGLFLIGVAFAWFGLMPPAITFLEGFQSEIFVAEWAAGEYLSFVTALLFWMGISFEMPLVLFVLSLLGVVGPRPLIRQWRLAVVGAAVAAAFITPTVDPVNMFLVMGPLLALYAISIVLVALGRRITTRGLRQQQRSAS
ncbi:MAG: twin-arginine translocase subunit TatC [Chloroflexota bacterium]